MADKKVTNDATDSLAGTTFQFCVALEQCFGLGKGERLWIEKFGDVTTPDVQIETKKYGSNLTDNHENLWKTLKNWCDGSFDQTPYSRLVLLTTQAIGPESRLHNWNDLSVSERLATLTSIWKESEQRLAAAKTENPKAKAPAVLLMQRIVMADSNAAKLLEVLEKACISSNYDGVPELWEKMKYEKCKGALEAKRQEFLADAFGYISNPEAMENGWEITFEGFDAKIASLYQAYGKGTREFPKKYKKSLAAIDSDTVDIHKEKSFVKKLGEIEYHGEELSLAISNYLYAHNTVLQDFRDYEISPDSCQEYVDELARIHAKRHRVARRNMGADQMAASQTFYDEITADAVQPFPGFDVTPFDFRNGIYHMLADEKDEVVWRLW
ncbi:hypothetical protein [Dyella sp. GSA-30]|uniref:hypothetical protein n=1 Tax=Dyella sp. GSA-30 TaxID=2994496 RepID=UPI00248F8C36|nr:hypothetical protein [Dyella sp. GSA-30]BDU18619.1 hypothetical protein DYGSA30_00760 [Dyella sp. GSA-30]